MEKRVELEPAVLAAEAADNHSAGQRVYAAGVWMCIAGAMGSTVFD